MSDTNRRRIDQVQDPSFLGGLEDLPEEELRERRVLCDGLDLELSYYRRMLHGRMDLVAFQMRRVAGETEESLIDALPRILAEGAYSGATPGLSERAVSIEVPDLPRQGRRIVDKALDSDFVVRLPDLSEEELSETQRFLQEVETQVSQQRRTVHAAIDTIQAELTRRYREGSADPDGLLTG